ncbi:MAG: hypothetical protein OEQ74_00385 [Gammaproteobacteria bacterium]|nr:hypothetical protein [Gammaproteobacteria bacterium]
MRKLFFWTFALLPAMVFADGAVQVQTTAQKEKVVLNQAGKTETRLVPVTTVVPGDEVIYTITFTNHGDADADTVTITDPVPDEMRYVEGSAFGGGTDILFSADGGKSFGARETLTVVAEDGTRRAARAEDYTHIRWTMRNPLQPGKQGHARFRAQLR